MGFSTRMVIHDDWMMWGYPHDLGNLHIIHISSVFIIYDGPKFQPDKKPEIWDFEYMETSTSVDPKEFPWEFLKGLVRSEQRPASQRHSAPQAQAQAQALLAPRMGGAMQALAWQFFLGFCLGKSRVSCDSSSLIQLFGIAEAKFIFSFELGRMFEIGTDIEMVQKESTIVVEFKEPSSLSSNPLE